MDIFVNMQVVLQDGFLEVEMLGQKICMFYILVENLQFAFQKDIPNLNAQQECTEVIVPLHLHQY